MDVKRALEKALQFHVYSMEFDSVEFTEDDPEFFEYVINLIKNSEKLDGRVLFARKQKYLSNS